MPAPTTVFDARSDHSASSIVRLRGSSACGEPQTVMAPGDGLRGERRDGEQPECHDRDGAAHHFISAAPPS